jgi:hypothetical protein
MIEVEALTKRFGATRALLSVFLRPDTDISRDVERALGEIPLTDPAAITVTVRHGVVTLAGPGEPAPRRTRESPDLIPLAIRVTWDVDGVVDVVLAGPRTCTWGPRSR